MTETMGPVQHRDNPYFGLDYYEEKFGSWFFGREAEGGKIITNLRAARLTLLHAESGVGKSSLLRAGVAWRMHKLADDSFARRGTARFVPIVFSSWKDDPVIELTSAIDAAIGPYLADRPGPKLPTGRRSTRPSRGRRRRPTRACSSCSTSSRSTSYTAPGSPHPSGSLTSWPAASTEPISAPTS